MNPATAGADALALAVTENSHKVKADESGALIRAFCESA